MSAIRTKVRVCILVTIGFTMLLCLPHHAFAAPAAPQASTIDADGDDERTELLYHWQDKRFSDEERHQILMCSALVSTLMIGGAVQRKIKRGRFAK